MIFRSEKFRAQWDSWLFYHEGVHYEDLGLIIEASEKMVVFLGTGSVWKDPGFEESGRFFINYSEWRNDDSRRPVQCILFAYSSDLIHWEKSGDTYYAMFGHGGQGDHLCGSLQEGRDRFRRRVATMLLAGK